MELGFAGLAAAGTGGTEFTTLYDTLVDWTQGTIGKLLILLMLVMAVFFSVVRPNFLMVIASVFMGLVIYNAADIIGQIVTATL